MQVVYVSVEEGVTGAEALRERFPIYAMVRNHQGARSRSAIDGAPEAVLGVRRSPTSMHRMTAAASRTLSRL